jgi:hypothetical protein
MADVAQTFALNPYAAEQAKIERLQKYAELLQSQGLAPDQKFGYAGIEAPPSAAGALAKGLQLGVSGYLQGRGMRKTDELTEKARAESKEFIDTLTGKPGEVAPTRGLGISDFEDRQVVNGKYDPEAGPQKLATALSGNIPVAPGQGDVVPGSAPLAGAERTAALLRGAVSGNPMIAPLASSLYAKETAETKLSPGEAVFKGGQRLYGLDPKAESELGRLADDFKNNRITKKEYDAGVAKATNLAPTTLIQSVGPNAYVTDMGQGLAKVDLGKMEAAQSAPDRIATSARILSVIDSDKAITGAGADIRLNIARGLNVVGGGDEEKIVATQSLISDLARVTMQSIKSSGLGAGAGFTDTDRAFLEKAAAGNIDYQPATIRRLAALNDKAARLDIKQGNAARARALKQPGLENLLGDEIPMPGEYAPPAGRPGGQFVPQPDGSLNWVPNANR